MLTKRSEQYQKIQWRRRENDAPGELRRGAYALRRLYGAAQNEWVRSTALSIADDLCERAKRFKANARQPTTRARPTRDP
jgi:hypothetical protein